MRAEILALRTQRKCAPRTLRLDCESSGIPPGMCSWISLRREGLGIFPLLLQLSASMSNVEFRVANFEGTTDND